MKVVAKIERMESNPISVSGDYSSLHDDCSIRLVCTAPKKKNVRIVSGSCHLTYVILNFVKP